MHSSGSIGVWTPWAQKGHYDTEGNMLAIGTVEKGYGGCL